MRRPASRIGAAALLAFGGLFGCSVSDTLTPPLDVGTSGSISKPLTGDDMQMAMRQNEEVGRPPYHQGGPRHMQQMPEQAYSDTSPQEQAQSQPQNSLEAQAAALQNGYNPVASAPLDGTGAEPSRMHRQSQQDMAEQQPQVRQQHRQQYQTQPSGEEAEAQAPQQSEDQAGANQQAALSPDAGPGTIRFLPIIGAPVEAVTPLSRQLGMEARAKGLMLRASSGEPARHILKGYFSAYGEGSKITVVYVWDVLDASGNRLHRIQGQEVVPGKAKDPWAAVPASTMQIIANKTLEDYVDWSAKSAG